MRVFRPGPMGAILGIAAGLCLTPPSPLGAAWALPEDRDQPLRVKSLRLERDQSSGVITYSGDVQATQGTLRIAADTVIVSMTADAITEIVATGAPATIEEQPAPGGEIVNGAADTIRYDVASEILTLTGKASIVQGESSVRAENLEYDLRAQRYSAQGEAATGTGGEGKVRTQIPASRLVRDKNE